jgi:hypothetical protein
MFYTNKYKKIPKELISFVELSPFVPMLGFVGSAFCSDVCAKQDNSFLSNLLSSGIAEGFLTYLPFVALTGKYTLDVAPNSAWDHSTFGAFFGLWMSVGICLRSRSGERRDHEASGSGHPVLHVLRIQDARHRIAKQIGVLNTTEAALTPVNEQGKGRNNE